MTRKFLTMQGLRGRFINLRECTERREEVETQLDKLNILKYYERFEAIRGECDEANRRGINSGELGLWKSWLEILKQEKRLCHKNSIYLHIIEDDCILYDELYRLMQNKSIISGKYDAIATDMYVNPSIYGALQERCANNKSKSIIELLRLYSGCTSSILIHSTKIEKIYNILSKEYESKRELIPIDNYLRRCDKREEITIGTTLPFLSSIRQDRIGKSTIQLPGKNNEKIKLTQEFCSILRRRLSISTDKKEDIQKLVEIYLTLVELKKGKDNDRNNAEEIIQAILHCTEREEVLRYKYRGNLKGEIDNPQNKIN